ncbi:hypothetical protein H4R26_000042 [Coemansia thaxteri]|uniref:CMP/dCMP-type deaminase domain-containing protein n=1 Tax=Coemansia thaxteri TaxID=2663907 RepID=A0A9W8BNH2_9FUNG|nr:hypothetical protein H4R26_000042 [Coemansia thaxteri]
MRFDKEHSQDEQTTRLIEAALEARNNAHCPYSKFRVGAALLTAEGKVFRGCNIESCSFSPTICAERVAIASAVVSAIDSDCDLNDTPITPCGVCRQAMREFGKDLTILLVCPDKRNQYYVGYVEDDESVDAIMKKFEELDKIEKEFSAKKKVDAGAASSSILDASGSTGASPDGNGGLIENVKDEDAAGSASEAAIAEQAAAAASENSMSLELLEEVFKRTSAFTVRGAMMEDFDLEAMDDIELWEAEAGDSIPIEWEEEEDYITLNLDDDALDDEFGVTAPRRRYMKREPTKKGGPKVSSRDQILQRYKYMQVRIQDRHGHTFFVSRKVNAVDPSLPTYVRIPPIPIPRAWVKHIRPLIQGAESTPRNVISGVLLPSTEPKWARRIATDATLDFDFSIFERTFQCVYMDPPLLLPGEQPKPGYFNISRLTAIPVHKMLVPGAFLFTWCEKELLPDMCGVAEREWGLKYVENFCWVRQQTNNHIAKLPSSYFRRSKVTLLIFRREGDLEMRHQRSPDSVFDFTKPPMAGDLNDRKPEFAYTVIETLLPRALCTAELPEPNRLVQLWMPADCHRTHWTTIVQKAISN